MAAYSAHRRTPHRIPLHAFLSCALLAPSGILLASNLITIHSASRRILDHPKPLSEPYDCILVLGAGISEGMPCAILRDRLQTAAEAYKLGMAPVLVVSGDRHAGYDEPGVMAKYLMEFCAIPESHIIQDPRGFSTRESVQNVGIMGYQRIVVSTQRYHLFRALRALQQAGRTAIGVDATKGTYTGMLWMQGREVLARTAYLININNKKDHIKG